MTVSIYSKIWETSLDVHECWEGLVELGSSGLPPFTLLLASWTVVSRNFPCRAVSHPCHTTWEVKTPSPDPNTWCESFRLSTWWHLVVECVYRTALPLSFASLPHSSFRINHHLTHDVLVIKSSVGDISNSWWFSHLAPREMWKRFQFAAPVAFKTTLQVVE